MAPQKNNQDFSSELCLNNAHDHFFRESMQDIEIARHIALLSIPSPVQSCIDWETLEIVKESWIDENLKEHRSDAIYRAKSVRNDQWAYLLFEHKSVSDKRVHVQLLRYIVEVWEQHEKQYGAKQVLPLVIPIVIGHCNEICKFDNSVKAMVAIIEGTDKVVPDFEYFMLDIWSFKPEQVKDGPPSVADYCGGRGKLKMLLLALKYSRSSEVLSVLPQIIRISEEAQKIKKWEYDYLEVVLLYLMSVIKKEFTRRFKEIVSKEHSGGEAYMETIADAYREEERLKRERIERELRKEIEQKNIAIKRKNIELEQKDTKLEQKDSVIEQKDTEITQKRAELEKKDEQFHQIIQLMLKKGIDPGLIRKIGGLSDNEIVQIIKEVNEN